MIKSVIMIGAGNLAYHLSRAMVENTIFVRQVFNRTEAKAKSLGEELKIPYTSKISEIEKADLYVIATAEHAIDELSRYIPFEDSLVVHCSGTLEMNVLKGNYRKGVLYPLQTFSRLSKLKYSNIPFFVEAEDPSDEASLISMATKISNDVHFADFEKRKKLHLAGVWVNNFVNELYTIAYDLLKEDNLDFDLLRPIINETSNKVMNFSPDQMQTGPAKRGEKSIQEKHQEIISDSKELELYRLLSYLIERKHQK